MLCCYIARRLTLCGVPEDVTAARAEAEELMRQGAGEAGLGVQLITWPRLSSLSREVLWLASAAFGGGEHRGGNPWATFAPFLQEPWSSSKVEGLVMKSLPARHRRRRKAPETARDEEKAWVHCECLSACAWRAVQASKAAVLELAVEELSNFQDPHPSVADAGVALEFEEERRQFEYLDAWMFGMV